MDANFSDMPCGLNCNINCEIKNKMIGLQETLIQLPSDKVSEFVDIFFETYCDLYKVSAEVRTNYPLNIALPALFDLLVSAKYAEKMISDGGWTYCEGNDFEGTSLYFPYLKTCPRCSVIKGIKPTVKSNKPQSDTIGDIASDATILIISKIIKCINPTVKIGKSSDRRGDVDVVIYTNEIITLGEIKSSPLSVYPLEIKLERKLTEVRDGRSTPKLDHTLATSNISSSEIFLFVPHINLRISLGAYTNNNWPYQSLIDFACDSENVMTLIAAWKELYDVYVGKRSDGESRNTIDNRRWLTCGCGGNVDDSKNAPGMDRTDDIKKGTYQALKFGTYYQEKCPLRNLRGALISNFMPLHTFERYLSEMKDVIWTKDKYSVNLTEENTVSFATDNIFNLYDALLCLTSSIFHDEKLYEIASTEKLVSRLINE